MAATHNRAMTHYQLLEGNSNAESFPHFIDDLAAQRDRNHLPANSINILDNVGFHRSPIVGFHTSINLTIQRAGKSYSHCTSIRFLF